MKKGQLPKARPILAQPKPKKPNIVRSSRTNERMDEYIQRFNNALYNNGIAKF